MSNNEMEFTKFIVLKLNDLEECLNDQQIENAKDILKTIQTYREETNRDPDPKYFVVNTDEPYSDKIKAIIDEHEIGERA